ncbi:MAG: DUF3160 domain-containing protein [Candidatus Marinimicrobia bacterium]|nr:DUF3160 domain-containing protein [Candidatus Neomarinimicrobiota bacterium]
MEQLQDEIGIWEIWNNIYIPTVFFVGKADDLLPQDYLVFAEQEYFESDIAMLSYDDFLTKVIVADFIDKADEYLPDPKISTITPKGMRFMGQRYIPDSYTLDQLVYNHVIQRYMPKSLDVMAALHSEEAFNLLDQMGDTDYPNYIEQLSKLKQMYKEYPDSQWAENLYWNWLYCLMPLLRGKEERYPPFMKNLAWLRKDLNTALSSWTELRHDTILYAKQSVSAIGMPPPGNSLVKGYVEPNPRLYARLASLAKFMRAGLLDFELLNSEMEEKLLEFEELMVSLRDIAIKELTNQNLSDNEYETICLFGEKIELLISNSQWYARGVDVDSQDEMPVIADVHTDPNAGSCLEEGIGYPNRIFVICQIEGELKIAIGGVFSYYEFIQPISDRLTDEQWRTILESNRKPGYPFWTQEFAVIDTSYINSEPSHYYNHKSGIGNEAVAENSRPKQYKLFQNYPNPFNPVTNIEFQLKKPGFVELKIYNIQGRLVKTLTAKQFTSGKHRIVWNASDLSSGIYFYKIQAKNFSAIKKCVLLQ